MYTHYIYSLYFTPYTYADLLKGDSHDNVAYLFFVLNDPAFCAKAIFQHAFEFSNRFHSSLGGVVYPMGLTTQCNTTLGVTHVSI
jgi:hypothetical protein